MTGKGYFPGQRWRKCTFSWEQGYHFEGISLIAAMAGCRIEASLVKQRPGTLSGRLSTSGSTAWHPQWDFQSTLPATCVWTTCQCADCECKQKEMQHVVELHFKRALCVSNCCSWQWGHSSGCRQVEFFFLRQPQTVSSTSMAVYKDIFAYLKKKNRQMSMSVYNLPFYSSSRLLFIEIQR